MDNRIILRVPTDQLARWRAVCTEPRGLSKAIRRAMDDYIAKVEVAKLDPAIEDPAAEVDAASAERREKVEGLRKFLKTPPPPVAANPLRCARHPGASQKASAKRCWCGLELK